MNITMIPTNKIFPNPNNRRSDLGDLTELIDSVKVMGVLQNLTVVPYSPVDHAGIDLSGEDGSDAYIVVIGNRRLAAAKAAQITELPCEISDLDSKAQNRVMLVENLMREGLTPYQEAVCIQQMLDMGDTVDDIAQQTGFSKTKVRSRAKLASFDKDKFAESESRGATMEEYLAAAMIEDADLRNDLLQYVGTKEFQWKLQNAKDTEKRNKNRAEQLTILATFATEMAKKTDDMKCVSYIYSNDSAKKIKVPDDADSVQYFYMIGSYCIEVYRCKTSDELDGENAALQEQAKWKANSIQMEEAALRAFELRVNFVKSLTPAKCKRLFPVFSAFAISHWLDKAKEGYGSNYLDTHLAGELLGITVDEKTGLDAAALEQAIQANPEWSMLVMLYAQIEDNRLSYNIMRYNRDLATSVPIYREPEKLDKLYALLTAFGYQMSEEEKSLQDGSHALYYREEATVA